MSLRFAGLDAATSRIIEQFDDLLTSRASVQTVVERAAATAGCAVRLHDPASGLAWRASASGLAGPVDARGDVLTGVDDDWPCVELSEGGARMWLEISGADSRQMLVLRRAALVARVALDRRPLRRSATGPESLELVLDGSVPVDERLAAAKELGLPSPARAVVFDDGPVQVIAAGAAVPDGRRAGIGSAVALADLPRSGHEARFALRMTARGTPQDPGPRVLRADELDTLAAVAAAIEASGAHLPDVAALDRAARGANWMLPTLQAYVVSSSIRGAARLAGFHHSTLQVHLDRAERELGWSFRDPNGRLRLQLALALHRAVHFQTHRE